MFATPQLWLVQIFSTWQQKYYSLFQSTCSLRFLAAFFPISPLATRLCGSNHALYDIYARIPSGFPMCLCYVHIPKETAKLQTLMRPAAHQTNHLPAPARLASTVTTIGPEFTPKETPTNSQWCQRCKIRDATSSTTIYQNTLWVLFCWIWRNDTYKFSHI